MTTRFVASADGTRIAYTQSGSGPALVFAHGASGDKRANSELRALLEQRFTVLAYDRCGRGESGDHPNYDFLKEADDLRAVVSAAGENPAVFGISMGARIALEALRDAPQLAATVLFEAPATDRPDPKFVSRLEDVRREFEAKGNEAATILHSRLFHQRGPQEIEELRRDKDRWALRVDSFPITLREMEAVHSHCMFTPERYPDPGFPVHLLSGDSTLDFLAQSATHISRLPFVRQHRLTGGDHSFPVSAPGVVFDVAMRALAKSPP